MGVKFGMEEPSSRILHAKFHPHRCNVSPCGAKNLKIGLLSKLNTGKFALRAMLPVTKYVYKMFCRLSRELPH